MTAEGEDEDPSSPTTLAQLFTNFRKKKYLDEENKYSCDKCKKKVNGITKNLIWELPQYLIISLGRYQYFPRQMKIKYTLLNFEIIYYNNLISIIYLFKNNLF